MGSRFVMYRGEPRCVGLQRRKQGQTHRTFRVLYDTNGVADIMRRKEWKRALAAGDIRRIAPADGTLEALSRCIGEVPDDLKGERGVKALTPQEALGKALAHLRMRSIAEKNGINPDSANAEVVRS